MVEEERAAARQPQAAAAECAAAGLTVHPSIEQHTPPAVGIAERASWGRADLIALATHGRTGLARLVAGSVALDSLLLIGAVVGSTDAAAVFSMMRSTPLPRRAAALLRVESGSNDPIAVMLTADLIATYDQGGTGGQRVVFELVQLLGGGAVAGLVGWFAVVLLRRTALQIEGLHPITVAAVLPFIARPLAVWACTLGQGSEWPERTVLTFGGLKGAVPIVLATLPLTAGVDVADLIFDIVFFVVLVSVLIQGTALLPTVRGFGFVQPRPAWAPVAEAMPLEGIGVDLIELHITEEMPIAGRRLAELAVPAGSIVTAVIRNDRVTAPCGDTRILDGDVLLVTTQSDSDALQQLTAWARGEK